MKIDSAASAGGPGKLAYITYFLWPLLEAELSISTLFFLFCTCWAAFVFNARIACDRLICDRNYPASSISKYNF
jgi:hypothetical protein